MTERQVTTRRGFLKISAAAATAAAVGVGLHLTETAELRWASTRGGPDFIHPLMLHLPTDARRQEAELSLIVETPKAIFHRTLGTRLVSAGTNRIDTPLIYPYEGFVLGDYAYTAIVEGAGFRVATQATAGFTMSPFRWLA